MSHPQRCPCPNCTPAGAGLVAVLAAGAAAVELAAWIAACVGVISAAGVALAWLSRRSARLSVALWRGNHVPAALAQTPAQPAVEAAPARLALEAAPVMLDGLVVSETSERMPA